MSQKEISSASCADANSDCEPDGKAAKGAAAGAVAGMGLCGLAAPITNTIGFGAGGIASGSTAASMMSAAAIANGGGVASGSTVAILQSIGAVGLVAPIGLGIVAAGAAIGGVASFMKRKMSKVNRDNNLAAEAEAKIEEKGLWVFAEILEDFEKPAVRTYNDEDKARSAFLNSLANHKALFDTDQKVTLALGWNNSMTAMIGM